jgi:DNA-binding transcriptional LysR family regulator
MPDIRKLDLNLLKVLDTLLETRSVTRTAAHLGLSQPAVSGMLARLRDMLDDPLFVRVQRGLLPTPRAMELVEPLRRMLGEIATILQTQHFDPRTAKMIFRISATDYAQTALVLPLLTMVRAQAPDIKFSVRPVAADFAEELTRGRLEIALVTPEMAPETLKARKLFDEDYVCILREGHPDADHLNMDAFCRLDHVIMSHDGTHFGGATDIALDGIGRSRRVVAAMPGFLPAMNLVRQSDMAAVVPRRLTMGAAGIVVKDPPLPIIGFSKIAVWHQRVHHDPAHIWMRNKLADIVSLLAVNRQTMRPAQSDHFDL